MNTVILIFLLLFLIDARIARSNQFFPDYCSSTKTNAIKGIFVACVFTSHFFTYVTAGEADAWGKSVVRMFGQLMVAPFLFYSGYGVTESIRKKGMQYINKLATHRALKTLIHFDIAVCFYFILHLLQGKPFTAKQLLLSFVCWEDFGNSTWYVFSIIALYLITAIAFRIFHKQHGLAAITVSVLALCLIFLLCPVRQAQWYNTMLCYVLGVWYSILREHVEKIVMKNDIFYCASLLLAFAAFGGMHSIKDHFLSYNVYAVFFTVILVLLSMKFSVDNAFLQFLGDNTFGIYILQRLSMIFCKHYGILQDQTTHLYILCFLITCVLSMAYSKFLKKLDERLFPQKRIA